MTFAASVMVYRTDLTMNDTGEIRGDTRFQHRVYWADGFGAIEFAREHFRRVATEDFPPSQGWDAPSVLVVEVPPEPQE